MNKELIRRRFMRGRGTYDSQAEAQCRIAGKMAGLIARYVPRSSQRKVVEVGCGTGIFTRQLLRVAQPDSLWLNDLCPEMKDCLADILGEQVSFHPGDAERLLFPSGQGLIVSCSAVQWFVSPELFFQRCADFLTADGYFSFTTFGKQNLCEIAELTGSSLMYRSLDELKESLGHHYQVIHASEELIHLSFASPLAVLKHLQETGVTGIASCSWTKGKLLDFCQRYKASYSQPDHKVGLTYHPIYIIAKKIAS